MVAKEKEGEVLCAKIKVIAPPSLTAKCSNCLFIKKIDML